jgi:predicted secreted hydrolase
VQSFFGTDPAVQIQSSPFKTVLGLQSIVGTNEVFPAHYHLDNAVPSDGPHVVIDIDAAASHELFLQGVNGYDGTPSGTAQTVGYYYYSWPQQAATGTVTINGTAYETSGGVVWMDHQFGGNVPVRSGPPGAWSGWSWFEFQFDGGISLTLTNTHGPIVNGIDDPAPGFGTLIMPDGTSQLVGNTLSIGGYTPSPVTTARYPSSWAIDVTEGLLYPVSLHVVPVTDVAQQAMWMGAQVEYAEAASTVTATGSINGVDVGTLTGVGYCESVGFEDTTLLAARQIQYLNDTLVR